MDNCLIYCAGCTPAAEFARNALRRLGVKIAVSPSAQVTHLLLDVPSFRADGTLRSGAAAESLLSGLPEDVTVCGGNLSQPALDGYRKADFLQDETYLLQNAYITAECTLDVLLPLYSGLVRSCPVLVIGWGRIGKSLSPLLRAMGAKVTVAARNPKDRAALHDLGFDSVATDIPGAQLYRFRIIVNTVPFPVIAREKAAFCNPQCLKIDLASSPGIEGSDVISARGLPGIHRPEASGELIAQTLLRYLSKEVTP